MPSNVDEALEAKPYLFVSVGMNDTWKNTSAILVKKSKSTYTHSIVKFDETFLFDNVSVRDINITCYAKLVSPSGWESNTTNFRRSLSLDHFVSSDAEQEKIPVVEYLHRDYGIFIKASILLHVEFKDCEFREPVISEQVGKCHDNFDTIHTTNCFALKNSSCVTSCPLYSIPTELGDCSLPPTCNSRKPIGDTCSSVGDVIKCHIQTDGKSCDERCPDHTIASPDGECNITSCSLRTPINDSCSLFGAYPCYLQPDGVSCDVNMRKPFPSGNKSSVAPRFNYVNILIILIVVLGVVSVGAAVAVVMLYVHIHRHSQNDHPLAKDRSRELAPMATG